MLLFTLSHRYFGPTRGPSKLTFQNFVAFARLTSLVSLHESDRAGTNSSPQLVAVAHCHENDRRFWRAELRLLLLSAWLAFQTKIAMIMLTRQGTR